MLVDGNDNWGRGGVLVWLIFLKNKQSCRNPYLMKQKRKKNVLQFSFVRNCQIEDKIYAGLMNKNLSWKDE